MKKIVWKIDDLFSLSLPFLFLYPLSTLIKFFSLFLSKPTSFQHHTHIEIKNKKLQRLCCNLFNCGGKTRRKSVAKRNNITWTPETLFACRCLLWYPPPLLYILRRKRNSLSFHLLLKYHMSRVLEPKIVIEEKKKKKKLESNNN
jgi:hypothetical protein